MWEKSRQFFLSEILQRERYYYKIIKKNYLATPPPPIVRWRKNGPFSDWFLGKPLFYILGIARLGGDVNACPDGFLSTSKWAISCSRVRALAKMICALFSSLQQCQKTEAGFPYLLRLTFDLDTWCWPSIIQIIIKSFGTGGSIRNFCALSDCSLIVLW